MGEDRTSPDLDRLTVVDAADVLSVSQVAVRKRIARWTIPHDRDESGRVYVYLSRSEPVHETDQDTYIRSPEDQIAFLRRELECKDTILLNLTDRIPQLETARDSEATVTVEDASDSAEPRSATEGAQEGAQRPWWRRLIGG